MISSCRWWIESNRPHDQRDWTDVTVQGGNLWRRSSRVIVVSTCSLDFVDTSHETAVFNAKTSKNHLEDHVHDDPHYFILQLLVCNWRSLPGMLS